MYEIKELVIPHIATIRQTAKLGMITEFALRQKLAKGTLPGYYAGTRFYVNVDKLLAELNGDTAED